MLHSAYMGRPKGSKNGVIIGPRTKWGQRYKNPDRTGKRCKYGHVNCVGGPACEKARTLAGAPSAWRPEINEEIIKFFSGESVKYVYDDRGKPYPILERRFPTFERFAASIGVCVDTLHEWAKEENKAKYEGFSACFKLAHELQKTFYVESVQCGASSGGVVAMLGKNLFGFKDTQDLTNDGGKFESPPIVDASGTPFKFGK